MPIAIDLHTHTLMSGHAYSTLDENAAFATSSGLDGFAVTDHAPAMPGGPVDLYFMNQRSLPRRIHDALVLRGAECNIIDYEGAIDLEDWILEKLDVCIASFHDVCLLPGTPAQHTSAWEAIARNPLVDILGHPGRGRYPFDIEHIVRMCKQHNKLIEINNHTLERKDNHDDCLAIVKACQRHEVPVVLSSDAHFSAHIGRVGLSEALLEEAGFPDELVLNRRAEPLLAWLRARKPHLANEF